MAGVSADIKGYRVLSDSEIDMINEVKALEIEVAKKWKDINTLFSSDQVDKRWMNIAKTHFQEGFSAFICSIAQPEDVYK